MQPYPKPIKASSPANPPPKRCLRGLIFAVGGALPDLTCTPLADTFPWLGGCFVITRMPVRVIFCQPSISHEPPTSEDPNSPREV